MGFGNYVSVFTSAVFTTSVVNTALFTAGSIVLQFVLGLGLALFFRRHFPLSGFLRGLLLLPWLLPSSPRARCGSGCSTRTAAR